MDTEIDINQILLETAAEQGIELSREELENTPVDIVNSINNSRIISFKENTTRFSGASWFEIAKQQSITLAGLGGIGRF